MISIIILKLILVVQITLSVLIYIDMEKKDETEAKNSKNLSLASLILSSSVIVIMLILITMRYVAKKRSEFLLVYTCMASAAILAIAYYYMDKGGYDSKNYALYGAVITSVIPANLAFFMVGRYHFSKTTTNYVTNYVKTPPQIIEKRVPQVIKEEKKKDCLEKAKLFII